MAKIPEGYKPQSPDTSPEADMFMFDLYRKMEPWQKLEIMADLQRTMDEIATLQIRQRHPDASEREVELHLAALKYDRELMIKAFGWDPAVKGY